MKDSQKLKKKKRLFKKINKSSEGRSGALSRSLSISAKKKRESGIRNQESWVFLKKINILIHNSLFIIHKHEKNILYIIVPLILLTVFSTIYLLNLNISQKVKNKKLTASEAYSVKEQPIVISDYQPYLSAKAAIIADSDSQTILFSKNEKLRFSMASTAKIMTALVGLGHYEPDSVLTVKSSGIEGSIIGLKKGESFYFEDLLYALLLPSANDAAVAIVDNYPGGEKEFVKKMNEKAEDLNLSDTQFSEPTGLNDDGNYTTVVDLVRLASAAITNKEFASVISTQQKIITNQRKSKQYVLSNLNKLLGMHGVNGVKTGTTEGAGEVLVTSAVQHGHTFIIVVMNSEDRFGDTIALLSFISENVKFVSPSISQKQ